MYWGIATFIAVIAFLLAMSVWSLVNPDGQWRFSRRFAAWQFRNGHEIELSYAGRQSVRLRGLIGVLGSLLALGLVLALWVQHEQRIADSRARTEQKAFTAAVTELWSPGDATARLVSVLVDEVPEPLDEINPDTAAGSIVGFQVVRSAGQDPAYLSEIHGTTQERQGSGFLTKQQVRQSGVLTRADLIVGIEGVCDVESISAESDAETVTIRIDRAPSDLMSLYRNGREFEPGTCERRVAGTSITLIPIDLPGPVGERQVLLPDGSPMREITGDVQPPAE